MKGIARTSTRPEARAQALSALDALKASDPSLIADMLKDQHRGSPTRGGPLGGKGWLGRDEAISQGIVALMDDPGATVRFQVALSLGGWDRPIAGRVLGRMALHDAGDRWVRAAVISSAVNRASDVLAEVLDAPRPPGQGPPSELVEPLIATLTGKGDRDQIVNVLDKISRVGGQSEANAVWKLGALARLLESTNDPTLMRLASVRSLIVQARTLVGDPSRPAADRASALRLVGRDDEHHAADRNLAADRLDPAETAEVQAAAVSALARMNDQAGADAMIERWTRLGPGVRAAVLDALIARPAFSERLIDAVEAKRIPPAAIDATHRQTLM